MTLAHPQPAGELVEPDPDEALRRLVAGWLLSYPSPHTRRAYARDLNGFAAWCAGLGVEVVAASRVHVDAWARHLAEVERRAPATVARKLAAVTAFYRHLVLADIVVSNPGVHARRPALDPDHSSTLGLEQAAARALLDHGRDHSSRMHALVALLLLNGLRRKGGRPARAPLPPRVADAVDTYLTHRASTEGTPPTGGPLFVTSTGARWRPGNAARALAALATHAGLPHPVTPHVLRHAAITLALDAGATLRDVQDFAGHADPRTTRRYDHARGRLDHHASYTLAHHLS